MNKIQVAAARVLAGLSQTELSELSNVGIKNISNFERGATNLSSEFLERIVKTFDNMGIRTTQNGGVEYKPLNEVTILRGQEGFRRLMDEVYEEARSKDPSEIRIINGTPTIFVKWLGQDWYDMHAQRMAAVKDRFDFKILAVNEGNEIAGGFAEYRWFDEGDFKGNSIYLFGNKHALIEFYDDDVIIELEERPSVVENTKVMFNIMWQTVGKSQSG